MSAPETTASPTKRPAEDEVPEVVEAKKAKADEPAPAVEAAVEKKTEAVAAPEPVAAEPEADADDEDVGGPVRAEELAHLDTKNIIEGRRTRGKKIDYSKLEQPDEDEDEEEDPDAEDEPEQPEQSDDESEDDE